MLEALFGGMPFFGAAVRGKQTSVMNSLFLTGLASLAARGSPMRVLEIGSWVGYSTLTWVASIVSFSTGGEVVCVDPLEPYFADHDNEKDHQRMTAALNNGLAKDLFEYNVSRLPKNVTVTRIAKRSTDALPALPSEAFDLVYIDGSHAYEHVKFDIDQAKRLVRDGGIVAGDDLDKPLSQIDEAAMLPFVDHDVIPDESLPHGLVHPGVAVAVKRSFSEVCSLAPLWSVRRVGERFLPVDPREGRVIIPPHFSEEEKRQAQGLLRPTGR